MNRPDLLTDELIQAAFERRARRADPVGLRDEILGMTTASNQPAAWRLRLANAVSVPALRPAWVALLIVAALLGIALAVAIVGQRPPPTPFRTGLLAYTQDGDLYLANGDGSDANRVVHDPGVAFSAPRWSPDGRLLALEGSGGVFVLDPVTLELRRLATGEASVWSSDSRSLAFVKLSIGRTGVIEVADIETGALRDVQPNLVGGASLGTPLVWSPDRRWFLARVNGVGVRFVRIDATTGRTVEIAPMHHLAEPGAHWSADSKRFAFARTDPCDDPPCRSSIVVEDADLSRAVPVSDPEKVSRNPIWSPDDAWIVFTSRNPGGPPATSTLSIVRPDGRDLRVLAETAIFADSLSWSADGTTLAFSTADPGLGVAGALVELRISDGVTRPVALAGGIDGYDWQAVAPDRSILAMPTFVSRGSVAPEAIGLMQTPPAAPPADPSGEWSGLAVDSYCDAGILDLRTQTPRMVGSRCPNSDGDIAFAPGATAYAISRMDGSVTLVRSDGTKAEALPPIEAVGPGVFVENQLAWSPDGRWLSVRRCLQDCIDPEYIVLSVDGRSLRQLPSTPSWSPDGQRLAVQDDNGDLLMGSPSGEDLHSIGTFPMPSSWSPDGTQFAFIRDGDAWIVNADGNAERNATNLVAGGVFEAIWSPDGRFIAVVQQSQLQILRTDGGELLPLSLGPGRDSFFGVRWSPDAARLAAVLGGETPATVIVQTDGWTATTLGDAGIDDITWSPDGRFIALLDRSLRAGQIDVANSDGSGRHTIWTASDGSSRVTWVP
jgi:Tol biopolymer transport system component